MKGTKDERSVTETKRIKEEAIRMNPEALRRTVAAEA